MTAEKLKTLKELLIEYDADIEKKYSSLIKNIEWMIKLSLLRERVKREAEKCPFCGSREAITYIEPVMPTIMCSTMLGGCGVRMEDKSVDILIEKWNRRHGNEQ